MGEAWGRLEDVRSYDWRGTLDRVRDYLPEGFRDGAEEYDWTLETNWEGQMYPLHYSGDPAEKADLLLVGKDYETDEEMLEDFTYFMAFDGEHRGLFAIPPFDDYLDDFNVWAINAGNQIGDYGEGDDPEGLIHDSRRVFDQVPFADYKAVLAKEGMGRGGFAIPHNQDGEWIGECWVKDAQRKREDDDGAAGLIHEVGHSILGLSDETGALPHMDAREPRTSIPNAAETQEDAEELWGHLVDDYDEVGFYKGALYNDETWKPHQTTIMGGGGLWSYGPVNELYARGLFKHAVWRDDRDRAFVDELYLDGELQDFVGAF